ncbi:hypothetical protein [Kitasatospora sp. NPDC058397]
MQNIVFADAELQFDAFDLDLKETVSQGDEAAAVQHPSLGTCFCSHGFHC